MSQAEGWVLAAWASVFVASLFFCWRFAREIPADERNDPFAVCLMWPLALLFVGAFVLILFLREAIFSRKRA